MAVLLVDPKTFTPRRALPITLIALLLTAPATALPPPGGDIIDALCVPHEPIAITEDVGPDGFVLGFGPGGVPIPRPGSGVSAGTGTPDDPFLIRGWCVVAGADGTAPAVLLEGTGMDVVVESLHVAGHAADAVVVRDAAHVTVRDTHFERNDARSIVIERADDVRAASNTIHASDGLFVTSSTNIELTENQLTDAGIGIRYAPLVLVEANTIDGGTISVSQSDAAVIRSNEVRDSPAYAIALGNVGGGVVADNVVIGSVNDAVSIALSPGAVVRGNEVLDNHDTGIAFTVGSHESIAEANNVERGGSHGIEVSRSDGVRLRGNVVRDNVNGVYITSGADRAVIEDNLLSGNGGHGVYLIRDSHDVTITHNTVQDNDAGITFDEATGIEITYNRVVDNGGGISVLRANGVINHNDIVGNEHYGLAATTSEPVADGRHNWWGCPDGPGASGCDELIASVAVSPWRTEPVPSAGHGG